jgi:hypothetical protein
MSNQSKGFAQSKPAKQKKTQAIDPAENDSKEPPFLVNFIVNIGMVTFGLFQMIRILFTKQISSKAKKNR